MDGHTEFSSLDRVCIPCSAVKLQTIKDEVLSVLWHRRADPTI